ncbi:alpha/beta fold hydrolase [bacterium]|nr:alpha/beta fold hydrolase [bacterium]
MIRIKEKPVVFKNHKGKKLWGVLTQPIGAGKKPAVLMVHGFHQTKSQRKFVELGKKLARNGIFSLRFDFSGCGDSEGDYKDVCIAGEVKDLKTAFDFLARQKNIDNQRIGFLAHSLGAVVTTLFLLKRPVAKALVFVAPAFQQKRLMKFWLTAQDIRNWRSKGYFDTPKYRMDIKYLQESRDYSPLVSQMNFPILILHGEKDKDVPKEFSKELMKYLTKSSRRIIVKEADHKFEGYTARKKFISLSSKWFEKYLQSHT